MSESDDGDGGCTAAPVVLQLVCTDVGGRREERWREGKGEGERELWHRGQKRNI